jgi:UDP-sulfoquinovose synthase
VYGEGGQTRGYLNLRDTLQCVELAMNSPIGRGELRILNQFTETFSVNELAERVAAASKLLGIDVKVEKIANPRREAENHYYNPAHSGLRELGLRPHLMTAERLAEMLAVVRRYSNRIDERKILPRVRWSG